MKKILLLFCVFILVQGAAAQKMILHMKNQGPIEVQLANVDSITFSTNNIGGGLMANPPSVMVDIGATVFTSISGGTPPYMIDEYPNQNIATVSIQGSIVSVKGVSPGGTSMTVKDNSIPYKHVVVFISVMGGPGGLMADPPYLELLKDQQKTTMISLGTPPYSIQVPPEPQIATAIITGSTVTVTGVGNGQTYMIVKDNSNPSKTASIDIRVRVPFTVPGSLSFNSTVKNFAANGIFINTDTLPTNSQGVGGFHMQYGNQSEVLIIGYFKNSNTNWDVLMMAVSDSGEIKNGVFPFGEPMTPKHGQWNYVVGWNPDSGSDGDDMFNNGYSLMTGSATISSITPTNVTGTFNGTGTKKLNGNPMPAFPITVTGGTFNVPLISGEPQSSYDRSAIHRLLRRAK